MFLLDGAGTFCFDSREIWVFVGTFVTIFKIVIPILLIIFGSIDLGKAVVASDDKAIKSATTTLVKRLIAAIVIFFIPTIVKAIFNLFDSGKETYSYAGYCVECATGKCGTLSVSGSGTSATYTIVSGNTTTVYDANGVKK